MTAPGFSRDAILGLLGELDSRLQTRGVAMDIQIVGGAALILHGLLERSTEVGGLADWLPPIRWRVFEYVNSVMLPLSFCHDDKAFSSR